MAALKNIKHEAFAQAVARGENPLQAFESAGYKPHHANAYRLRDSERVSARIEELREKTVRRLEKSLEIDADRLTKEFARIGLANITDVLKIEEGRVHVFDTAVLSEDVTAAIAEIRETKEGIVVKMHSKPQALENLAKRLGYYRDPAALHVHLTLAELVTMSYQPGLPDLPDPKVIEHEE
jgi:phage terminase small subunit